MIVEVKAQYKHENWNIKDEEVNAPRKHCIFPGWEFWVCMDNNLVIKPDTAWLASKKDKPIYDIDGNQDKDDMCLPGSIAAALDGSDRFDGYTPRQLRVE